LRSGQRPQIGSQAAHFGGALATWDAFAQVPLKRDLFVLRRVTVELSRIDQWEISASHGFSQSRSLTVAVL
jgi:hypothetical protein